MKVFTILAAIAMAALASPTPAQSPNPSKRNSCQLDLVVNTEWLEKGLTRWEYFITTTNTPSTVNTKYRTADIKHALEKVRPKCCASVINPQVWTTYALTTFDFSEVVGKVGHRKAKCVGLAVAKEMAPKWGCSLGMHEEVEIVCGTPD